MLKHSPKAPKGITDAQVAETGDAQEETSQTAQELTSETGDAVNRTDSTETAQNNTDSGQTAEPATTDTQTENTVSGAVEEVVDLSGCVISYDGAEATQDYTEGTYFSMTPDEGNQYIILKYTISNNTTSGITVDVMDQRVSFSATIGGSPADALSTVLPRDLANVNEVIKAGESIQAQIIFEVPEGTEASAENVKASVTR